jgi:hypothetical protein
MAATSPPPIPIPVAPQASANPLTPAHLAELALAQQNFRPIRRVARTATFSAVTTLFIAACSVLFAVFSPDIPGILIALGLCAIGTIEWIGSRRLLRAEPGAARFLMRNQLGFLGLIGAYCIFQIATTSVAGLKQQALSPEARAELAAAPEYAHMVDQSVEQWGLLVTDGFYVLVLVISIACQGGLAFYYASRRKRLEEFQASTPPWARQLISRFGA